MLRVSGAFGELRCALAEVDPGEPLGNAPWIIRLPGGASCEVRDHASFAAWAAQSGWRAARPTAVMHLQRRWRWAAAALGGIVAFVAATYLWLLPAAAEAMAPMLPERLTRMISDAAMQTLDGEVLKPSGLSAEAQRQILSAVERLAAESPDVPRHRILFRASPLLGANAFALPSGDIVILDPLVALGRDPADTAAVVAHELGHVAHHHGMRQLIQSAVVSFAAATYLGDVSSLAASLSALLVESSYSRAFEYEADDYGARMLLAAGESPTRLAEMLVRLEQSHAARGKGQDGPGDAKAGPGQQGKGGDETTSTAEAQASIAEYLSSHPATQARIARLHAMR